MPTGAPLKSIVNVLHIDEQTGWRGGELQTSWIVRGLAERGHTVVIAGRKGSAFLEHDYGVDGLVRIEAPFRSEFDPWTIWKLARAVQTCSIDVLHAQTSHAHTYACLARAVARRGKVVVSRRVSFAPKTHLLNRWKYGLPDRFIAVSQHVADVLLEYGVAPSRVRVDHSSIDLARIEAAPLPRAALGIPEGAPLIGNTGALVGHKDHQNLIAAMPAVLAEMPDVHLVIAGEGELRASIEAHIERLGLGDRVRLLGHRKDAPAIVQALDVYVSSSWSEGLGTSVLEALACGVPVVATVAGGVPEMVIHEQTGLLVPARDSESLAAAILRMLRDESLARVLARNGKAHVESHFTVDRMVEGNIGVYEELLQSG